MLGLLAFLGPSGIAIALGVSLLGTAGASAYGMHKWDNATYYKAESVALQKKLHTIQLAEENDAKAAQAASAQADFYQGKVNELLSTKITDGSKSCFSKSESDSLRGLWGR